MEDSRCMYARTELFAQTLDFNEPLLLRSDELITGLIGLRLRFGQLLPQVLRSHTIA